MPHLINSVLVLIHRWYLILSTLFISEDFSCFMCLISTRESVAVPWYSLFTVQLFLYCFYQCHTSWRCESELCSSRIPDKYICISNIIICTFTKLCSRITHVLPWYAFWYTIVGTMNDAKSLYATYPDILAITSLH
jgi:hypothetical protein